MFKIFGSIHTRRGQFHAQVKSIESYQVEPNFILRTYISGQYRPDSHISIYNSTFFFFFLKKGVYWIKNLVKFLVCCNATIAPVTTSMLQNVRWQCSSKSLFLMSNLEELLHVHFTFLTIFCPSVSFLKRSN